MRSFSILAAAATAMLASVLVVRAQDGTPDIPSTASTTSYSCNNQTCVAPTCFCASLTPPGGLAPASVPQFVTLTFDDSIQVELLPTALKMLAAAKNPNGCLARGTWFVSIQYTDFSLVEQWYSAGNEVADHTWTHVGSPPAEEIEACKDALNAYAGIPLGKMSGFRAPFLNYTIGTFQEIGQQGFTYDSSTTAVIDDANWPYTLDNGLANDCWSGVCGASQLKLPGVWEIPMASVVDNTGIPQLMDVYLAGTTGNVTDWYNTNWQRHYNGNRSPFGIYVHPTHLTNYVGLPDTTADLNMMLSIITNLASQPDVWFVTNQQLLEWMKNPVPASEMASQSYMQCTAPIISHEICNGLDDTNTGTIDANLTNDCNFMTSDFQTCFNCPATEPTAANPVPASSAVAGQPGYRYAIPTTCDTPWWDPIGNTCLCNSTNCAYKDLSQPIHLNGTTNGTTNGTSSNTTTGGKSAGVSTHSVMNLGGMILATVLGALAIVSL
ncbi:hypothetical protein BC937DRAFT_91474 [Endogone sp. FLAS-F59071]|nr:hypothetical protein BC937DRAFT_91474 [Endogone sp. FLAS-F59071]|eukprot:RUS16225.1 hypothetical protein BC937DRAFT_91474 [Endogone sp. FLAS-F59071]